MKIDMSVGTYVVAVSGGIDSMALLHMLTESGQAKDRYRFVVAHFDHGIRPDSDIDRRLVQSTAKQYGLPFVYDEGQLGPGASEAKARTARYRFLHQVRQATGARGIITAHHKDDVAETVVLQLQRGTGRRGLSSLKSTDVIYRPLLSLNKAELVDYAQVNGIEWREDSTNIDTKYARNHVRHHILPKLSSYQRAKFDNLLESMSNLNNEIDSLLDLLLHQQPSTKSLDKKWFLGLPHKVAKEVLAHWLRRQGIITFDKKLLEQLVVDAKAQAVGQVLDLDKTHVLKVKMTVLALGRRDR